MLALDSRRNEWNVQNGLASQVQIFYDWWILQNLWWLKYTKLANFLRSLNINTAEFGCSGCVCVFSCLVCMKILVLSFIKLGCKRYCCGMKENILNSALSPLGLVYIKFLALSVIKIGCKCCIDWKRSEVWLQDVGGQAQIGIFFVMFLHYFNNKEHNLKQNIYTAWR